MADGILGGWDQKLSEFFGPINRGLQSAGMAKPDPQTGVPPADLTPLMMSLGLLHPRLGGATRDMGMAHRLAGQGEVPAAMQGMPQGMPAPARPAGGGMRQGEPIGLSADPSKVPGNQNGNFSAAGGIGRREQMRAYESYIDSLPPGEQAVAYQTFRRMQSGQPTSGGLFD